MYLVNFVIYLVMNKLYVLKTRRFLMVDKFFLND